ncbi:hypothetical protein XOC_0086 [Xanthomonas oryzae pv. oryzicola BLS256]|uniref:Uncharacterized protein n=1 Tax=Xanthomonas oryzae pv. oryzicola (strain BLS256) TaxID=383407 RepID=G7TIQ1_XANOB|nr:hypothetical protein XOC_0086 [Xanthomonas oryzae pv. oryzicola BLS256]
MACRPSHHVAGKRYPRHPRPLQDRKRQAIQLCGSDGNIDHITMIAFRPHTKIGRVKGIWMLEIQEIQDSWRIPTINTTMRHVRGACRQKCEALFAIKNLISPDPQLDVCCSPANSFVLPMFSMTSDSWRC